MKIENNSSTDNIISKGKPTVYVSMSELKPKVQMSRNMPIKATA